MTRVWIHDCTSCRYLGTVTGPDPDKSRAFTTWDLYWCEGSIASSALGGSLIARWSSVPSHYLSYFVSIAKRDRAVHPAILWALALLHSENEVKS